MATVGAVGAVGASPATTTWTTYLYQGPGERFSVVDEVPQATAIDDAQCADGWCKVALGGRIGYLKADVVALPAAAGGSSSVLAQPAAAADVPVPRGPCVEANQTSGNGGNAKTIFCLK